MLGRAALVLVTALLMFPQIAETIYSPALTDISARFSVSAPQAALTLSVYFIGFAIGVLLWGGFSDRYGRRPALLAGLGVYALGCLMALWATDFSLLLAARIVTAAGAATGSVVTQTVLRDCYHGRQLVGIFSFIGLALAVSPAVGVYIGGGLTALWGMRGVFSALALLAAALLLGCLALMPETRPQNLRRGPFLHVLRRMVGDTRIALAATLVAAFNVSLFSYYSLAPFLFARFDLDALTFGYSGMALAAGSLLGALLNHRLLRRNVSLGQILAIACILHLAGGVAVYMLRESIWFVAPVALVTLAWAMAIPLVLGSALSAYGDCRGTAGAFFGLFYYVLIGAGLLAAGWGQSLGASLLACAGVSMLAGWRYIIVLNEG
ncbi:MFS transporter [Klebsiella michiganensis]|uniref:MFS transporter n=1 Tax=Klebsiella michiganensis TaxID=1134687 RepID=UPI00136D1BF1|nr:MFS transporter [Klebsiella michiganensis]MXJ80294.1 MFS transporter [Klebsiella michiganensis]